MNRTDRLLGILLELQARAEGQTELRAEDLARRFEVSVRTVYRDVQALSETGVPVVASPGKGYRLMPGFFLPPLSFSAPEAALLIAGGEFVRERVDVELRRVAEEALSKLAVVLPPARRAEVARRTAELRFPARGRPGDDPHLARLRLAVHERRVVRLLYHAYRRAGAEPREVEPLLLVHLDRRWHLAAWCRLRLAQRLFRLDRIDRLEILAERFTPDGRHTPRASWSGGWERYPQAWVRFEPEVVRWVRERRPYFLLREEQTSDGPLFVFGLRDEDEVIAWLLSWAGAFEVLGPERFRARIATAAQAVLARHRAIEIDPRTPAAAPAIALSGAPS